MSTDIKKLIHDIVDLSNKEADYHSRNLDKMVELQKIINNLFSMKYEIIPYFENDSLIIELQSKNKIILSDTFLKILQKDFHIVAICSDFLDYGNYVMNICYIKLNY